MKEKKASFFLATFVLITYATFAFCAEDPLPSWNEGATKQAIIDFVWKTTSTNQNDFIPVDQRIAAFDQDGTLWTEMPVYTQFAFAVSRIKELEKAHPEWKNQQPYQAILEENLEQIQRFTLQDIQKIIASTHAEITTTEFQKEVVKWLEVAKHPRFNKLYTELIYQPMVELINYLKEHHYKVYIVSGGGQDFIRAYSEKVYGIPKEQVIGSAEKTRYEYQDGLPVLVKLSDILFVDDRSGKPEAIHLFIGNHPALAAGNSDGDREMLQWSQASKNKNLQLLVHHDDPVREYAYGADSKIGTFSKALKEEALLNNWIIISMKDDWKKIFP